MLPRLTIVGATALLLFGLAAAYFTFAPLSWIWPQHGWIVSTAHAFLSMESDRPNKDSGCRSCSAYADQRGSQRRGTPDDRFVGRLGNSPQPEGFGMNSAAAHGGGKANHDRAPGGL